ncbi:ASPH [Symbiodinium sp. KB8]|nr:ASPH [Symbiodinium sp. KB8]
MAWDLQAAHHGAHFLDVGLLGALGELWFFRSRTLDGRARSDSLHRARGYLSSALSHVTSEDAASVHVWLNRVLDAQGDLDACRAWADKCVSLQILWEDPYQRPGHFLRGLRSQPWYPSSQFELCRRLESAYDAIKAELLALSNVQNDWSRVGGRAVHDGGLIASGDWQEVILLGDSEQCFANRLRCPATSAVLSSRPEVAECARLGVGEALFSLLKPHTKLRTHCGPTNMRLTCHLGLIIPDGCHIIAGSGPPRIWKEGACTVFDDSYEHSVENRSDNNRIVLLVNFWHPDIDPNDWVRGPLERNVKRKRNRSPVSSMAFLFKRWGKKACVVCGRLRTRRCKHCRQCGRCVARFDHHCPWLGNCIGEGNLNVFLRFLASTLLSLLLAIGLAFEGLEAASLVLRGAELPLWYTAVSIMMVIDGILVLFVGCVFTRQVLLAAADLTEYEDSVEDGIHLCTILRRTSVRILLANSLKWFLPYKDARQDAKDPDLEAQLSQRGTDTAEKQAMWPFCVKLVSSGPAVLELLRKVNGLPPPLIPPAGYKVLQIVHVEDKSTLISRPDPSLKVVTARSSNPAGPERERACPVIVVTVRGGPTRLQLLTPLGTSVSLFQGAGLAPTPSGRSAILSSSPTLTAFCAPATLGGGRLRLRVHDSGKDGQLANLLDVAAPTPTSIFSTRPVGMEETVTTEATARSLQLQLQQEHFVLSGEIQKAMPVWTILRVAKDWGDPLYIVKLDVAKAFDSVSQLHMVELITREGAAPAAFSNKQSQNWQQQQQQQSWQGQGQKEDTGPPRVHNLQLFQESQLTTQGFPPEAPAIVYDKSMHVFSSAHSILQEIVGDISVEVEIHHDTEWDIFPEIGESIRHAGAEELCFSVGTCPNQGRWAVGIANGWKGRETAVKLALGFSLLADRSPDDLENFCKNYPEFRVMVAEAGLLPPRGPAKRSAFNASQGQQWQSSPKQNSWSASPAPASGGFPKFVWASLDNTAGLVQEGLPAEGLCVYHDKQFADLFKNGQYVLQEDMLGRGQRGPSQIPEDDDILWRSSTWSGETQIKPQLPEEIPGPLYTDAKCYGGRFTYAQWRKFVAQERQKGMQQDASGQTIEAGSKDFSWNTFIQFFRPEIWLLVLLHADAAALRAMASCCRGFQQITVPWRRRGTSSSTAELEKPEMPVVQLAARLRCGLPLAEELLHLPHQIQLPGTCRSWLDLLYQQENKGAWLCLVHAGGLGGVVEDVQVVEDFCQAVAVAERWSEKVPRPQHILIALLPSAQQHSTAEQSVCIRKAVKIIGLPLPVLTGAGEIELRSRWQAPEPPGKWRAYLPMLSLRHLEVALDVDGCVEIQNCILSGSGATAARPSGVCDSVLHVQKGVCLVADCEVRLKQGHAGFGVVVGPDPASFTAGVVKPHCMLKRVEVTHATTACICYMGGQLTMEDDCTLQDCEVGISACDQGSIAFIAGKLRMACRDGGRKFEQVSGGIVTTATNFQRHAWLIKSLMQPAARLCAVTYCRRNYAKVALELAVHVHHLSSLTYAVLGDVGSEVVFTHDPDWEIMPEMAEAIKQAGGEENCYAVASVPSAGIWAVGLAGGWKVRELACKLALSVALVASSGDFDRFGAYPDFVEFAQTAGTPGAAVLVPACLCAALQHMGISMTEAMVEEPVRSQAKEWESVGM